MTHKREKIENACTAVAIAMAELIDAVLEPSHALLKSSDTTIAKSAISAGSAFGSTRRSGMPPNSGIYPKSPRRIYVYMAGARGLAMIAETYGSRIAAALEVDNNPYVVKCGTTTADLPTRMRQIGQDRYGAAIRTDTGIEIEDGFSAWISHMVSTSRQPYDPAVRLLPRAIGVDLPTGMTRRTFDSSLHAALKSRSLDRVPMSDMPRRFVAYDLGKMRINAARELYLLSPHDRADGDFLLDAVEGVLAQARVNFADKGTKKSEDLKRGNISSGC